MKKIMLILSLLSLLLIIGCQNTKVIYQCNDGSFKNSLELCDAESYLSPSIFISKMFLTEDDTLIIPYIVTNIAHDDMYRFHVYENLYDSSDQNLWADSSDIGVYEGNCGINNSEETERNLCIYRESGQSYIILSINIDSSTYPEGIYDLEIRIVDEITKKENIIKESIRI